MLPMLVRRTAPVEAHQDPCLVHRQQLGVHSFQVVLLLQLLLLPPLPGPLALLVVVAMDPVGVPPPSCHLRPATKGL